MASSRFDAAQRKFLQLQQTALKDAGRGGSTVTAREMGEMVEVLGSNGFSVADATLLNDRCRHNRMDGGAERIFAKNTTNVTDPYDAGEWTTLHGKVQTLHPVGIGGEAPPAGEYLMLNHPLTVDGLEFDRVFLGEWSHLRDGQRFAISGRLDLRSFGGIATQDGHYVELSGKAIVTKGEPRYDGTSFHDPAGRVLPELAYTERQAADLPANIFVPDSVQKKMFVGTYGRMIAPESNPFHEFQGARPIEPPNRTTLGMVRRATPTGPVMSGPRPGGGGGPGLGLPPYELLRVGEENGKEWFLDLPERMLFRMDGQVPDAVVHLQDGDLFTF